MTDQEFMELLNLYVDREITPQDALRLEAAVQESPRRREIHDQYCRIQKACAMLSEQSADSAVRAIEVPAWSPWMPRPIFAGLAAACIVVTAVWFRGSLATPAPTPGAAEQVARAAAPEASTRNSTRSDSMEPVFVARPAAVRPAPGSAFAGSSLMPQQGQLNWIGDIHLAPVPAPSVQGFLLGQRPDPSAVLNEAAADRDPQAGEMAAFRFQR